MMPPADAPSRSLRIFVVEDHADTLRCLTFYFQAKGHTVESAGSVAAALRQLATGGYDLLLCDITLPDGTGWELREQLGQFQPPFAVAMSGYYSAEDRARSRAVGFQHHLAKPLDLPVLDTVLELALLEGSGEAGASGPTPSQAAA